MKIVKILILYIKALKFRHDVLKFKKETKDIDFKNTNFNDINIYFIKGEELKMRSYEIEEKLHNLK